MNLEALKEYYFVDLIAVLCNLLAFISTLKAGKKKHLRFIIIYIQVNLGFNLTLYCSGIFIPPSNELSWLEALFITLSMFFECTLIFKFFSCNTNSTRLKKLLLSIYTSFIIVWLIILIPHPKFFIDPIAALAEVESFAIVLFGFFSLQFKIKEATVSEFFWSPEFYIFLAIIGYFSFSIPFFLGRIVLSRLDSSLVPICECINLLVCSVYFITIKKGLNVIPQN